MRNTTKKILANVDLLNRAWGNFYRYHKLDPHNHHVGDPDFWELVPSQGRQHGRMGWLLSPEDYRRTEALAGPYYCSRSIMQGSNQNKFYLSQAGNGTLL